MANRSYHVSVLKNGRATGWMGLRAETKNHATDRVARLMGYADAAAALKDVTFLVAHVETPVEETLSDDATGLCPFGGCEEEAHAYSYVGNLDLLNGYVDACPAHAAEALFDLVSEGRHS